MGYKLSEVPAEIIELVDKFQRNIEAYKNPNYKEEQLKQEFINPFFKALGWDVDNIAGAAPQYRDVIFEDSIKIAGGTRAPDYCFTLAGRKIFFVEAKKPSVNIDKDIKPSYQLRRYAWSAKLPLSILTDFEELAVYESRSRPKKNDRASNGRIKYLTYKDYVDQWEYLYNTFSKDAVLKGSYDKYAETTKKKKGTTLVDDEFLSEIETWRELLAKDIALRNSNLTVDELNYSVQQIIDRIIFLRMAEDRGAEKYGQLQKLLNKQAIYQELCEIWKSADEKYNSGLFHFKNEKTQKSLPDTLTPQLEIKDGIFKQIIKNLYYPDSPYEFSVLSPEILGNVYEQFLGKVIRLTAGHRAKVEEKPEVKKAGGVYYTHQYIVDYIVENTIGKLCKDKTPKKISELRILDPACGSGSFLLGAYNYLLNWHLIYYSSLKDKNRLKDQIYKGKNNEWHLTIKEKKRILLNNIFGVDIDHQAVEVTKLSLLLKVLEGENKDVLEAQQKLFKERALPDLENNIKCGNSLIGPDIYNDPELDLTVEDIKKINPFDWEEEFEDIIVNKGFDTVIGNPPWGANFSNLEQKYLQKNYNVSTGRNVESYVLFIESAIKKIKNNGYLSFITPDTFLRKDSHVNTRTFLLENRIEELIETGPVFAKVRDTWAVVFLISKGTQQRNNLISQKKISRFVVSAEERLEKFGKKNWDITTEISQSIWSNNPGKVIGYFASELEQHIISKIELKKRLSELKNLFIISRGEEGSKYNIKENAEGSIFMMIPNDVNRYYMNEGIKISDEDLAPTKLINFYKHPKIWIIRIQKMRWPRRLVCVYDERSNSAGMKTLQLIVSANDSTKDLKFLQGLLSSKLLNYYCTNYLADDMNKSYLEKIPIFNIEDRDTPLYDKIVFLVETMLKLHKDIDIARTPQSKELIQRQIDATDKQIDVLVYELYGLTKDEIKIVEESSKLEGD